MPDKITYAQYTTIKKFLSLDHSHPSPLTYKHNRKITGNMANATAPFIVVGIDGTSSASWRKPDGSNSHVYKFVQDFQYGAMGVDKLFLDGPNNVIEGRDSEPILQKALDFINHRLQVLFRRQLPLPPPHPIPSPTTSSLHPLPPHT